MTERREIEKIPESARETGRIIDIVPTTATKPREDDTGVIELSPVAKALLETNDDKRIQCLLMVSGLDMGNVVPIPLQGITIGRDTDCDLVLRDDGVSRRHTEVRPHGKSELLVMDLNSTNGTYINGRRISSALIGSDSKLLIGRSTALKFLLLDEVDLRFQQEMFESTTTDGLTGVYNRKYLMQKLVSDLSFAKRHYLPFALLMFDIDHFKKVNDHYGHQAGDEVLKNVAKLVKNLSRTEDVVGRYGGEEFAVIAQGTPPDGARAYGERIRHRIADEPVLAIDAKGRPVRVTISVGVATLLPGAMADMTRMISVADANLYRAKELGRDRVVATIVE